MEELKIAEIPEVNILETSTFLSQNPQNQKKGSGIFLSQLAAVIVMIIILIALKVFLPDTFSVLNEWINEKLNMAPLSL